MTAFIERRDLAIRFSELELVETHEAPPQQIQLFRHGQLGLILVIDGEVQHVENWQTLYHEPLVHVPAAFVPVLESVLILGGGSLFAAAEVFRYPTIKRCILVDHDFRVLELAARHYEHARTVMRDPRFEYISGNALDYLLSTDSQFDLIVNDCFDTLALSKSAEISVFDTLKKRLSQQGVCADLVFRHVFDREHGVQTKRALETISPSALSLIFVPEYPGILHFLAVWGAESVSQDLAVPLNLTQLRWCSTAKPKGLQFFDPAFLSFFLYLPPFLAAIWAEFTG